LWMVVRLIDFPLISPCAQHNLPCSKMSTVN
jgi:hypothetical protein